MNRFYALADLPGDVESQHFCSVIGKYASEVVGHRSNIHQLWLYEYAFNLLKPRAEARIRNDHTERKRLHGIFKARANQD